MLAPPDGFTLSAIALVGAGLTLAGVVKGATGLGYASCALPFLVYALGLKPAIALVLMPAMATNVAVALGNGHLASTCRTFAPLYVAMLPGIAIGVWLLGVVDAKFAVMLLGLSIIGYVAITLGRPQYLLSQPIARALQIPVGLANGVLTGLTGSQVMPMVPYLLANAMEPQRTVQAINLGVLLASAVLLAGLVASGTAPTALVALSVVAVLPALAGVEIGRRMQRHIAPDALRTLILVVLAIAGAGLMLR